MLRNIKLFCEVLSLSRVKNLKLTIAGFSTSEKRFHVGDSLTFLTIAVPVFFDSLLLQVYSPLSPCIVHAILKIDFSTTIQIPEI